MTQKGKLMPHPLQNRKSAGKTREHVRPVQAGMAWYTPENYKLLLRLSVDTSARHPTYKGWLDSALQAINNIRALGLVMVKVQVDVMSLQSGVRKKGFLSISKLAPRLLGPNWRAASNHSHRIYKILSRRDADHLGYSGVYHQLVSKTAELSPIFCYTKSYRGIAA